MKKVPMKKVIVERIAKLALGASLALIPGLGAAHDPREGEALQAKRSDAHPFSAIGRQVAGSYYLEVLHEGFPPAAALVTLTRDGGFISTDVSDEGAGGLSTIDSPVHGTWRAVSHRVLEATTVYFGFDKDGIPVWIARSKGSFRFSRDFSTGAGELLVERFTFDQDPLDPNEVPADQLKATFTARRITTP